MKNEITYKGHTIKIIQDENAESPQSWGDGNLFLVANHRQFYVAEPGAKRVPEDPQELVERYGKTHWIFPLEAYIHSGVRLAFGHEGNFPDRRWDVSQLGFVFVAKSEWRLSRKAREAAATLIKTWNDYLSGDVWGYQIDEDGDSCWGFYGYDYCLQEARSSVDYMVTQEHKARLEQVRMWIKNRVPLIHRTFPA